MTYRQLKKELQGMIAENPYQYEEDGTKLESWYLGSYMSLDPCGHYHHFLSPNDSESKTVYVKGVPVSQCELFWDNLDKAASELGGWIESGEGDPTDIYFVKESTP